MADRRGLLIILSSPSGAGKSTLARKLREWDPNIGFSISVTTRKPRPGEIDGREYHFVSNEGFQELIDKGAFLEWATVFGNRYGTPREAVEIALAKGQDILFDIDWQGAQQLQNSARGMQVLSIFLLPPSIQALYERLKSRGQDDKETVAARMKKSWNEISHWAEYDHVLINDDLDETTRRLRVIVEAARLRRIQQPGLNDHVRALQREFEDLT